MEEAPLSTSMAIPTLGASRASAPPANPANVHTEFAVPTMQRASTTEPLALPLMLPLPQCELEGEPPGAEPIVEP